MKGKIVFLVFVLALCGNLNQVFGQKFSGRRFALLIGNSDYEHGFLKNPVNDTKAIETVLENLDFKVTNLKNQNRKQMLEAVSEFTDKLEEGDLGLFFYAGHGMQIEGSNYLVPLNAGIKKEADVEFECMALDRVMANLEQSECSVKVLVLDCCRDNPLSRSFSRSKKRGLGAVAAQPNGTIIAFSTKPGEVASDGNGDNSPYTASLISVLEDQRASGLELIDVFRTTAQNVAVRNGQRPFIRFDGAMDRVFLLDRALSSSESRNDRVEISRPPSKKKSITDLLKIDLAKIPAGTFLMGGEESLESFRKEFPDEMYADLHANSYPQHRVTISRPFRISKYETTIGQFRAFVEDTDYQTDRERGVHIKSGLPIAGEKTLQWDSSRHFNVTDKYPVTFVSWNDAQAYCKWLSKKSKKKVALPTQAQWEYACRAGTTKRYSFGNDTKQITHFANVPSRPTSREIEIEGNGRSLLLYADAGKIAKIEGGADGALFVNHRSGEDSSATIVENASKVVLTVDGETVAQGQSVTIESEQVDIPFRASLYYKRTPNSKWKGLGVDQGGAIFFYRDSASNLVAGQSGFSVPRLAKTNQIKIENNDYSQAIQIKTADGIISVGPGQRQDVKAKLSAYWAESEDGFPNQLAPVGQFEPNKFGLFDMHGNVWEWCQDGYDLDYSKKVKVDPAGSKFTDLYAIRGGCYI